MATHTTLRQRNSDERVSKLRLNRLTLQGRLSSLESTKAAVRLPKLAGWIQLVAMATAVAACAGIGGLNKDSPPEAKEAVVRDRAQARWQALIKGDLDAAYEYLSPASKAVVPVEAYRRQIRTGLWRQVRIDSVACEAELCVVQLQLTYDAPPGRSRGSVQGIETPISERWVIENGSAWFVYR